MVNNFKILENVIVDVDIYDYANEDDNETLFAFHVYIQRIEKLKGKNKYVGTYTVKAFDLDNAIKKLKDNDVFEFFYNGGSNIDFKSIKELNNSQIKLNKKR